MSMRYTSDHEWALLDGDLVVVGITDYAQEQLGEVVFVELPDLGRDLTTGEESAVVESVKAAGEVKAPVSGEVVEVNESLEDAPEAINDDPVGDGWFYKILPSDPEEFDRLMDESAYQELLSSLG